jgi:hypothetical protein
MNSQQARLCYILQVYQEGSTDCSPHLYRFLEELARRVDLFVVIERTHGTAKLREVQRIYSQRWHNRCLRTIEIIAVLLWARCLGYR